MNRKMIGAAVAAMVCLFASCGKQERVVDYPLIEVTNTRMLDITRVELTDTATVVTMEVRAFPEYIIQIGSDAYLQADGKEYKLTGAQGIVVDSLTEVPEPGNMSFSLCFEPLPRKTKAFDLIDAGHEESSMLWGIDLTGKKDYDAPEGVPAECLQVDEDAAVPEPVFASGETTLRVHFLGWRKEMGRNVDVSLDQMFGKQQHYIVPVDPETGVATCSFMQYGTAQGAILSEGEGSVYGQIWLAPGEEADVYIDMRLRGYYIMCDRYEHEKVAELKPFRRLYASGKFANLNNVENIIDESLYYKLYLSSGEFGDYRMTGKEYVDYVLRVYQDMADSIANSGLGKLKKELLQLRLKQDVVRAVVRGDWFRELNYRKVHQMYDLRKNVEGILPIYPEDVKALCRVVDFNDPQLLMGTGMSEYVRGMTSQDYDWVQLTGATEGIVYDLQQVSGLYDKAVNAALTEADFEKLRALKNPFYLEVFTKVQQQTEADLAAAESKKLITPTPDVPKEELFDAMIAPYKGKVIVVDFWNTWCAPCRAAIQVIEPMKAKELKSDDLVWIYIANETSPIVQYQTQIANMQGVHYRLSEEQWDYICDGFGIMVIPSYVLVDKEGNYALREDFGDHERMKEVLLEML